MKAWQVYNDEDNTSTIVFAPTRGKAKSVAVRCGLFAEDIDFINISCYRNKHGDQFYNGKSYLSWENDEDRLLLVKEFDFACSEDYYEEKECPYCVAKKYCPLYERLKEEEE